MLRCAWRESLLVGAVRWSLVSLYNAAVSYDWRGDVQRTPVLTWHALAAMLILLGFVVTGQRQPNYGQVVGRPFNPPNAPDYVKLHAHAN